jgi:hypothetical protein
MTDSSCKTNINNDYDNFFLFKTGILNKDSPTLQNDRKIMFQFACLPVWFILAFFLLYISDIDFINIYVQNIISILIIGFSIYHLQTKEPKSVKCQWWDNNLEVSILHLVLVSVIVGLFYEFRTLKIVSMYMIFSILIGLLQSIIIEPFKP